MNENGKAEFMMFRLKKKKKKKEVLHRHTFSKTWSRHSALPALSLQISSHTFQPRYVRFPNILNSPDACLRRKCTRTICWRLPPSHAPDLGLHSRADDLPSRSLFVRHFKERLPFPPFSPTALWPNYFLSVILLLILILLLLFRYHYCCYYYYYFRLLLQILSPHRPQFFFLFHILLPVFLVIFSFFPLPSPLKHFFLLLFLCILFPRLPCVLSAPPP